MEATTTLRFAGRFEDWAPLGEGGEGRLYRVRDRWTGRLSALKVAEGGTGPALTGEFRLLSLLRHPCLIVSRDLIRDPAETAHLMDYVPAVLPAKIWERGGEDAVWAALVQSLRGLVYLHRHDYVHGDVTPGNILVWQEGENWRARLADLGLALPVKDAVQAGVRGTAGYMAPETARGEGYGPAADLYGLASTVVAWVDGRGPWDGLQSGEVLKRIAQGVEVPRPKRRISPELESVIANLGKPNAHERTVPDWSELLENKGRFGEPALVGTVVGLHSVLDPWKEWVSALPPGQVGTLVASGRAGSGRGTLCQAMARSLVVEGWTALWDVPTGAMRDWLAEQGQDPDPVRMARELGRRFLDHDVVILWPEKVGELESRLLRAFVAGRGDESSEWKTVVLKVSSDTADSDRSWLAGTSRTRVEEWSGLDEDGLRAIHEDLFAVDEGFTAEKTPEFTRVNSPLGVELQKQSQVKGHQFAGTDQVRAAIQAEVGDAWGKASETVRDALVILSWSGLGWAADGLAEFLGAEHRDLTAGLDQSHLIRRTYEADRSLIHLSEWMTREAVVEKAAEHFSGARLKELGGHLDGSKIHPGDLDLAGALVGLGVFESDYVLESLDRALSDGRYEGVLGFGEVFDSTEIKSRGVLERILRAAQRLGKFPKEVATLEGLLKLPLETGQEIGYRKMLAKALASLGKWQEAVEQCQQIESAEGVSEKDRIWARLQRAETLWQAGRFAEADDIYGEVEGVLTSEMKEEWLRYAVGRARQAGQRGDMGGVEQYLGNAENAVGRSFCEKDVLYLHTLGGLEIQQSKFEDAHPLMKTARLQAQSKNDWATYIMVSDRASNVAECLGNLREATRIGKEALATATALGSERIVARVSNSLTFNEMLLGNLGGALRRVEEYLQAASKFDDHDMEVQGHRLLARIAAHGGFEEKLASSIDFLQKSASKDRKKAYVARADFYAGIFNMGKADWNVASDFFQSALSVLQELGRVDDMLEAQLYLSIAKFRANSETPSSEQVSKLMAKIEVAPRFLPIMVLAKAEMSEDSDDRMEAEAIGAIENLWLEGRCLDIVEWASAIVGRISTSGRARAKGKLLSAVQRIANSIDDASLKKQFLSLPRTQEALTAIKN